LLIQINARPQWVRLDKAQSDHNASASGASGPNRSRVRQDSPDLPVGLIFGNRVNSPHQKYFAFPETGNPLSMRHPEPARGALRDRHGCWARDAMDAKAVQTSAAGADGEVVWS
jgi:hypothetical protein